MIQTIVLATQNPHKIDELKQLLSQTSFNVEPCDSQIKWDETGSKFEDNALIKSEAVRTFNPHNQSFILADDSGLVVPELNGDPGVYSSRYAGDQATDLDNNHRLIRELMNLGVAKTSGYFCCALSLILPSGESKIFKGECHGVIQRDPIGSHGFGYDPHFFLPELGKTMAELNSNEKNSISHRRKALDLLLKFLSTLTD